MPRKFSEFDPDTGPSISVEVVGIDPDEADPALQNVRIPLAYLKGRTYAAIDEKPLQEPIIALFFGDSNCYGYAGEFNNENAPTETMVINNNVFVWQGPHSGSGSSMVPDAPASFGWVVADPNRSSEWEGGALFCGMKGFGGDPVWSWANSTQQRTGRPVYILKLTRGGMPIADISPPSGYAYSHYIAHCAAAVAAVPDTRGVADFEFCMLGAGDAGWALGPGSGYSPREWRDLYQARRGDADNAGGIIDQAFIDEEWTQFVIVGQPQEWDWWKGSQMAADYNNARTRFIGYRPFPLYDPVHLTGDGYLQWGRMASGVTLEPPTEQNDYPADSGALTWRHTNISDVLDEASAVAFKFDTDKTLATLGQRLFEFKNFGADRVWASVAGELNITGGLNAGGNIVSASSALAIGNILCGGTIASGDNIQANSGNISTLVGDVISANDVTAANNVEATNDVIAYGNVVTNNILAAGAVSSGGKLTVQTGLAETPALYHNSTGTAVTLDQTESVIIVSQVLTTPYTFTLPDALSNIGIVYRFITMLNLGLGGTINVPGGNLWFDEFPGTTAITLAAAEQWELRAIDLGGTGVWSRVRTTA